MTVGGSTPEQLAAEVLNDDGTIEHHLMGAASWTRGRRNVEEIVREQADYLGRRPTGPPVWTHEKVDTSWGDQRWASVCRLPTEELPRDRCGPEGLHRVMPGDGVRSCPCGMVTRHPAPRR